MSVSEFMLAPPTVQAAQLCCCNFVQKEVLISMGVSCLLGALLWNSLFLSPIKLVAVFFHELGHATAALITGGKVKHLEVSVIFLLKYFFCILLRFYVYILNAHNSMTFFRSTTASEAKQISRELGCRLYIFLGTWGLFFGAHLSFF